MQHSDRACLLGLDPSIHPMLACRARTLADLAADPACLGVRQRKRKGISTVSPPRRVQGGASGWPAGAGEASGSVPRGSQAGVDRNDRRVGGPGSWASEAKLGRRACERGSASKAGKLRWATSSGAGRTRTRARVLGSHPSGAGTRRSDPRAGGRCAAPSATLTRSPSRFEGSQCGSARPCPPQTRHR